MIYIPEIPKEIALVICGFTFVGLIALAIAERRKERYRQHTNDENK